MSIRKDLIWDVLIIIICINLTGPIILLTTCIENECYTAAFEVVAAIDSIQVTTN